MGIQDLPPPYDGEQHLLEQLEEHPNDFTHFRVMGVEEIETAPGKAPKYKKRGELGKFPVDNLLNPGLYEILAVNFGGYEAGKPFDIALVRVNGRLGPQRRVFSCRDSRSPEVVSLQAQTPHFAQNATYTQQTPPFQGVGGGWGPAPPYWAQKMMQDVDSLKSVPKEDSSIMALLIQHMLNQATDATKATAKGVSEGMKLAREINPVSPDTVDYVGIVKALGEAWGSAQGAKSVSVAAKAVAARTRAVDQTPMLEDHKDEEEQTDFEQLGFIICQSIEHEWEVSFTAKFFLKVVSDSDIESLKTADMDFLADFLESAGNAYPDASKYLKDEDITSEWVMSIGTFLSTGGMV